LVSKVDLPTDGKPINPTRASPDDLTSNPSFLKFLNSSFKIWASLPNSNNDAGYANQRGKISAIEIYNIYIEAVKKYIK
jgi:hypothetical protein